ncbi:hypothetical protein H9P43_000814 [Blastocladiella emersonii ATCC 22665]|nr:hypothetical protein H9P43_000814 [Blastocladiella emersonii ATCC 22665]
MSSAAAALFAPARVFIAKTCPFAQRASIALHELGLITSFDAGKYSNGDIEVVLIDLKNKPDWYLADINPRGKVPALEITHPESGKKDILVESSFIAEYLLQAASSPLALAGANNAFQRYRANMIVDAASNQYFSAMFGLLREKNADAQPAAAAKLLDGIRALQTTLDPAGPFALGTDFTIADVLTAPFVVRIVAVEHFRGFKVPETAEFARFRAWRAVLEARASLVATTPTRDELIEGHRGFAE